ncbi:MAG: carboxypeptidase-like regulatory domain-containing protein, partial [Bacteroidetes bacterium]|nr:carboxypeptidase-like regulatory domain-containing protein [Bacteroidota bacterium]
MQETRTGFVLIFAATIFTTLISSSIFSQGTVKGFIRSEATGAAVMFASVSLEGTRHGVVTDVSGFYSISKVPEGEYNLIVSSIEYENYKDIVYVTSGKVLTKNYLLKEGVVQLEGAEVSA